jgi:hypothetical protein
MKHHACVGALELSTKRNLRLLTAEGENQPKDTPYRVGGIFHVDYTVRSNLIEPHVEDVLVNNQRFLRTQDRLCSYLKENVPVWKGDPTTIFGGLIQFPHARSGYITRRRAIPSQSVGFWIPDKNLELTILDDERHYFYFGDNGGIYTIPYVGYEPSVEQIPKGTLIRVSLARWWKPTAQAEHKCYLQLSGWYVD